MIDWGKPVQWSDGTTIDMVEVGATLARTNEPTDYIVTGPEPKNWPEDCVSPRDGVYVNADGSIAGGFDNDPLRVINVPEAKAPWARESPIDMAAMETSPLWGMF